MRKIVVCADQGRPEAVAAVEKLRRWVGSAAELSTYGVRDESPLDQVDADLVIVFGGDGAMLATARKLRGKPVPVVGVNIGKFGFLAELTVAELEEVLPELLAGKLKPRRTLMLECSISQAGRKRQIGLALNDVVISGAAPARMSQVAVSINDEEVASYRGDGVIVATPVGSTAYSISAGGPILERELEALVITPICAHSLSNRPLVVASSSLIKLRALRPPSGMSVTLDGQVFVPITPEDEVWVSASERKLHLIETGPRSFHEILRTKLGWKGEPNYVQS